MTQRMEDGVGAGGGGGLEGVFNDVRTGEWLCLLISSLRQQGDNMSA